MYIITHILLVQTGPLTAGTWSSFAAHTQNELKDPKDEQKL